MNRIERKQQLQFALACVVVGRGHNGNQVASAFQGGLNGVASARFGCPDHFLLLDGQPAVLRQGKRGWPLSPLLT